MDFGGQQQALGRDSPWGIQSLDDTVFGGYRIWKIQSLDESAFG